MRVERQVNRDRKFAVLRIIGEVSNDDLRKLRNDLAADAEIALRHARDTYTRRMEGISLWVVPSASITASDPGDDAAMFDPAEDKIYRHPTFYDIPDGITHI